MSGPLLSRENAPQESRGPSSKTEMDPETELYRLLELLDGGGNEKLVDAYFSFLLFCSKNMHHLRHLLTATLLKPHCLRLFKEYRSNKERLRNDPRFVQCMMWFGLFQPRMYKDVVDKGIGDRCAVTFVMYAKSLAKQGDLPAAVGAIKKGLDNCALPISYLEDTLRELQGNNSSTALQPKETGLTDHAITPVQNIVIPIDPHMRYTAEDRDFAPDQVRTYDFRAVYPECNPEEFQFEERRLHRWLEKKKIEEESKATQNVLKEKTEIIESLRETIAILRQEKTLLTATNKRDNENNSYTTGHRQMVLAASKPSCPVSSEQRSVVLDDNRITETSVALTSTQKSITDRLHEEQKQDTQQGNDEVSSLLIKNSHRENSIRCESTMAMNSRTEMMTRDMRELFWNGTLNSTNMAPSAEATPSKAAHEDRSTGMEANSSGVSHSERQQDRLQVFEENVAAPCLHSVTSTVNKIAVFEENDGGAKRKAAEIIAPAKRFAACADENQAGPSNRQADLLQQPKLKVFDENPNPSLSAKDDEDKENIAPKGYQQPPPHSRRLSGVLVDAEGFETAPQQSLEESEESLAPSPASSDVPVVDEDLGVGPLEAAEEPPGRFNASTPTKNTPGAHEVTWRVTEVLRGNILPPMMLTEGDGETCPSPGEGSGKRMPIHSSVRHLSTILEASKESGSSGSSNSLGTPSLARPAFAISQCDDSMSASQLDPILSDPFNPAHRNKVILGSKIVYETVTGNLPHMKKKTRIQYRGGYSATIVKMIGEGGFAKVYFAQRELDDEEDAMINGYNEPTTCIVRDDQAAIKITKEITAGLWEFYILNTVSSRLTRLAGHPCIRKSIPEPHCAAYYQDGFLISLPFLPYGSLLDLVNSFEKAVPEELARYFVLELMIIIMRLHETGIIHGDLKPDNVLFRKVPTMHMVNELRQKTQCICLIDFGQAIDVKTFPAGTTFSRVVLRESHRCAAMREGRDWLYDFDWFGVANCAHTLLFGEYIEIEKKPSGDYGIKRRIPRYWANDWWDELFSSLLNMNTTTSLPGQPDNPVKKIIELGGDTLCDRKSATALSLKLINLNTMMSSKRRP
ncbi:uncharacterized protein LOC111251034 isoform X1 [Varroa destructor]|uniref:Protein kinase domain-containing protein n=2 Tax=Varroa destructor TaxID=109461 RepID=A0A7M7K7U2_VARDE|nr:uncharacterized protein LOC111251034 isoform X1 [Varroa destructor]